MRKSDVSTEVGFKGRFADAPNALNESDVRNRRFITHAEVQEQLAAGGFIKGAVIESSITNETAGRLNLLYLSCSWGTRGYRIFRVFRGGRPRFFRDLDRLICMIRDEFGYSGPITLRTANTDGITAPLV